MIDRVLSLLLSLNFLESKVNRVMLEISRHRIAAALYKTVKNARPAIPMGWHIWHNTSFNPIYRAEQDWQELSQYSDFIKVVMYNNCGAERMALYVDSIGSTLYRDLTKQQLTEFTYEVMGYEERSYEQIPHTGLSPDYVSQETKRALAAVAGTKTQIWCGIDVDIPTEPPNSKRTRQKREGCRDGGVPRRRAGGNSFAQVFGDEFGQSQRGGRCGPGTENIELKSTTHTRRANVLRGAIGKGSGDCGCTLS